MKCKFLQVLLPSILLLLLSFTLLSGKVWASQPDNNASKQQHSYNIPNNIEDIENPCSNIGYDYCKDGNTRGCHWVLPQGNIPPQFGNCQKND